MMRRTRRRAMRWWRLRCRNEKQNLGTGKQVRLHLLTYDEHRSIVVVDVRRATQTHRCRIGNPDRALEPRAEHRPRRARSDRRTQAGAVYYRAQAVAGDGRERPRPPRREAAVTCLLARAAPRMAPAGACGRPAAPRV